MNAHTPVLTPLALEHAELLRALAAGDFTSKADLGARLGRDHSNLNKTLKRLAAEGFVDFDATALTAAGANAVRELEMLSGRVGSGDPEGSTTAAQRGSFDGFVQLIWMQIEPDPLNPRKHFDPEAIEELADSILRDGLLENLVVRPGVVPADPFLMVGDQPAPIHPLVAGERRHRAIKRLIERGDWSPNTPIMCRVVDLDDAGHRRVALVENLQRKDLRPIDEANALKELMAVTGVGTSEVAKEIGFTQRFVQQRLQLLELPAIKQVALQEGKLSIEAARQWLAARPELLEISEEDNAALLEIGWAVAAKPNTQWSSLPCDYAAPRDLETAGLVQFMQDWEGRCTLRLSSKAYGHLRRLSGCDDSLVRALLEPHVRKARILTIGGSPLSADHDPKAFEKVDALFKAKQSTLPWLNAPHRPDPAVAAERERRRQAQANAPEPQWRIEQREREAVQQARKAKGEAVLPLAQQFLADFSVAQANVPKAAEIIAISHPLPWKWFKEADNGGEGIQDANGEWVAFDGYGDAEPATAMVVLAIVNGFFGHESRVEIEPDEVDGEDLDDDEVGQ